MKRFLFLITFAVCTAAFAERTIACTTFCLKNKGQVFFGKNYDWMVGDGMIFVNRRGVAKTSAQPVRPASWISRYGSVTFNQYGWEAPSGGMNEVGLVIELMWLDDTKYPSDASRSAVDVLEWIQYHLDTAATTAEVVASSDTLRINSRVTLHYLVNDRNGNSAAIEFLDGRQVVHMGESLPMAALTNDTYERSLKFVERAGASSNRSVSSLDRFARASARTRSFSGKPRSEKDAVAYAFETLADAAQPNYTQWSIVYDQVRGRIHFRTLRSPTIRTIDANSFDYACKGRTLVADLDADGSGAINSSFVPYTREMNRALIERAFNKTEFLRSVPTATRDDIAAFPERFACGELTPKAARPTETRVSGLFEIAFPLYYIYKQIIA